MALKMNQMKCPSCGANLEFDGARDRVFCTYCGTPIVITDENRHEIVHRQIDEAAIERERRKLRKIELDAKEKKSDLFVAFGILGLFVLIGIILLIIYFAV